MTSCSGSSSGCSTRSASTSDGPTSCSPREARTSIPDPGVVVWLTGLPASGKSTLAWRVHERLAESGRAGAVLDGDVIRNLLGNRGYGPEDRDALYAGLASLAATLAAQGLVVLVPATAHRRAYRDAARALAPRFVEVYVRATPEECARRDPKGLYALAKSGRAPQLPGVGVPYEAPERPEVIANGGWDQAAVDTILARLGAGGMR